MTKARLNKKAAPQTRIYEDTLHLVLKKIEKGVPYSIACEASGMSHARFKEIVAQGKLDLHHKLDTMHSGLLKNLRTIESQQIESCIEDIRKSEKGHTGAQWILERKYWRHFSSKAETLELAQDVEDLRNELAATKNQSVKENNDGQDKK